MVPRENINDRYKGDLYCSVVYRLNHTILEAESKSALEQMVDLYRAEGNAPGRTRLKVLATYMEINEIGLSKLDLLIGKAKSGRKFNWKQALQK